LATLEELQADLAELRTARMSLAKGERVDEVWRDGRRLIFGTVTVQTLTELIAVYEQDIAKAEATASDRPARSAIGVRY